MTFDDIPMEPLTTREKDILRLIVAGLSNREIGLQLFLSEGTVKWHNKSIFDKLDVRSRTEAIVKTHQFRLFHEPPTPSVDKPRSNLPSQPTAFVGREKELQEIVERIRHPDCRLLTLIGSGGSGKTRLAIQSAAQLLPDFRDGVYFTPLEALSSPDQVIVAVAEACRLRFYEGVDPRQQVFDFLHRKEALLVLDNFEHLLEARSDVHALLEHAPHAKVMVSARAPLHLPEEWVLTVKGMTFPEQASIDHVEQFDAIRLFLACATRGGRTLSLANDLPHVASICQLTQGMPLAIELAASWLRSLTCQEITRELRIDTDLLATPTHDVAERHQSMRRVFEHSWSLLSEDDRRTLCALSVFRGGFASAAVRAVTGASLTDLARLIDHSLVQVTGDGRYDLHPLISQYLQEHLLASGDQPLVSAAHAAYYADFLDVRRRDLTGGRLLAALNEVQTEYENVFAAWLWLIDHQDYENLEKAFEPLLHYVNTRGGEALFDHLRRLPLTSKKSDVFLAYLHCFLPNRTEEEIQRALAIAEQHGSLRARAFALRVQASMLSERRENRMGLSSLAESLALFRQLGEDYYVACVLIDFGGNYSQLGEKTAAEEVYAESLRLFRSLDNPPGVAACLHEIASRWFFDGDYAKAEPYVREALAVNQEFGNRGGMLFCTQFLGHLHLLPGKLDAASQLYHAALAVAEDIGGIWRQAFALLLGMLANAEGNYSEADAQLNKSRAVFSFHEPATMFTDWAQSVAHCGLRRFHSAREYLCAALKCAMNMDSIAFMTLSLPPAALILWNDEKHDVAVEMMALAFSHSKSQQGWFVKSPLSENVLEQMKAELGEDKVDAAWQRGTERDLHATSAALLALFAGEEGAEPEDHSAPPASRVSNVALPLILTARELDVLRLLADGLTNPEIADRLYLSSGTIKVHTRNIYGKLGVSNRTQAVTRAQKLHLL